MTINDIEARLAQIRTELEAPDANLDALQDEVRSLQQQREELRSAASAREALRQSIAAGAGNVVNNGGTAETPTMSVDQIRGSAAYVNAYADFMRTGDPRQCRALLTTNVETTGSVPVPTMVDEIVRTAWERDALVSRVTRTYFRGNLKVSFELTASDAVVHVEGSGKIDEENLTLGVVDLVPETVKKFVRLSDEAAAMGGEALVRYIYDELAYRIVKKLAALIVGKIVDAPADSTKAAVGITSVSAAPSVTALPAAATNLSDEATELCVVMNRLTDAQFLAAQASGNFAIDPYAGMTRVYTNALPAYSTAESGAVYAIVGDLKGVQANYPEGDGIAIKYDDLSEAEADMIRFIGRQYVGYGVVAPGRLVKVTKP